MRVVTKKLDLAVFCLLDTLKQDKFIYQYKGNKITLKLKFLQLNI